MFRTRVGLSLCLSFALAGCTTSNLNVPLTDGGLPVNGDGPPAGGGDGAMMMGGCGSCPAGYTCGSANGIAVCRAPSGVPLFSHVFVIVMENTSQATLKAATNTPFLTGLYGSAASAADYHGVAHPSLPNYLALTSGGAQGVTCDCQPSGTACTSCNALFHSCGCDNTANHLGDQLETAGKTWRAYAEDMGTACNLTDAGNYATKHVPFLYYDDVQKMTSRCNDKVVDYAAHFGADLAGATPAFAFIAPNLVSDMHDPFPASATNYANGDGWLGKEVPKIQMSSAYKSGGVIFIVWDEDDLSGGFTGTDDPVPMFVLSPLAKSGGFVSMTRADHYALLATIEDGLGVGRLGMAGGATPLGDYFPAQ